MNDLALKYNYIYFNASYSEKGIIDSNEFNSICLRDLENINGVQIVPCFLDYAPRFIRRLYGFISLGKLSPFFPFKEVWYPFLFRIRLPDNGKNICFVIAKSFPLSFIKYLRSSYKGCKVVKIYRDLFKTGKALYPEITIEKTRDMFDLQFSYDREEAEKFGFIYFDGFESKIDIPISDNYPLSDVFFAGKAKERLPKILEAYRKLTSAGLKCDFFITNAPKNEQIDLPGITYSDHLIPYSEVLFRTVNSKCVLDINQNGAVGYTARFSEAVIYNKLIISDNQFISESNYYNPEYVQLVSSMGEINPEFIKRNIAVDYHYAGDFSPVHLIKKIDNELQ